MLFEDDLKNTDEQDRIVNSESDTIIVNAFAGTGKTTTLVDYAKKNKSNKMLYIAFNKSVVDEANKRFPKNVESRTSHSLAFQDIGSKYKNKLGELKAYSITKAITQPKTDYTGAKIVVKALNRFMSSTDNEIGIQHFLGLGHQPEKERALLEIAKKSWDLMISTRNRDLRIPHDGYLKLYQLSNPSLSKYDTILLDEAQDTNPCLFDIFQKQKDAIKVMVGDTHQNIYEFRGSMDVMSMMTGENLFLTTSFRFGDDIAEMANIILQKFKKEKNFIKGQSKIKSMVTLPEGFDPRLKTCYLSRTNAVLFDVAARLINKNVKPINFVGGVNNYGFDLIQDVHYLRKNQKDQIKNNFIKSFNTLGQLERFAHATEDNEIKSRVMVAKKYDDFVPNMLKKLRAAYSPKSNMSLTTAHKSKGLEWDQVILSDDFIDLAECTQVHDFMIDARDLQEINLLYVAMTRAKNNLILNPKSKNFLEGQNIEFRDGKFQF